MAPIDLSYLICTTPRSGSNFLCEVMRSTGVAGNQDDYFWNSPFWYQRWGVADFPGYIERILLEGTTPNGVFGVKMMWSYLEELVPQLAALHRLESADPPVVVAATFPHLRYIWLTRRDKVRQGVSWYRALQTQRWRSTDTAGSDEPIFDFNAISGLVQLARWEDDAWRDYFSRHGIEPLTLAYEELAAAPDLVTEKILRHLRISDLVQPVGPWQHRRQADVLTQEWVERYLALAGNPPRID